MSYRLELEKAVGYEWMEATEADQGADSLWRAVLLLPKAFDRANPESRSPRT